jgi:hypothetical protein
MTLGGSVVTAELKKEKLITLLSESRRSKLPGTRNLVQLIGTTIPKYLMRNANSDWETDQKITTIDSLLMSVAHRSKHTNLCSLTSRSSIVTLNVTMTLFTNN